MSAEDQESQGVTKAQSAQLAEDGGFFEQGKGQRGMWFQIFDGSICLKSREIVEGWEGPIETTHPKTKEKVFTYVKRFDSLVARVVNIVKVRKEFDDGTKITNYNLTLVAQGKKATLQLTYMDAFLRKFLKVAPNINFEELIRFSAFKKMKNGKDKQLISIKQGTGSDYQAWDPVPFYWEHEKYPNGEINLETKAKGADGTILPAVIHDEEDDTWDFKAQNKFLVSHFTEHQLPTIKAIAERLGIKDAPEEGIGDSDGFTGGPTTVEIPVVTSRPSVIVAPNVAGAMTSGQATEIRKLAKQVGKTADFLAQKMLEAEFDDLSIEGAAYLKYRIEKKIKKAREEDPTAYPDPEEESKLKLELERRKAEAKAKAADDDDDEDDDDWDTAPTPTTAAKKAPVEDDDDDDDDDPKV